MACARKEVLPVKVVLSLREDWLAAVSEIEERIPEVFRARMRLLPLTREQACQAIIAPVERLGISYEPALVERLLNDLTTEGVIHVERGRMDDTGFVQSDGTGV